MCVCACVCVCVYMCCVCVCDFLQLSAIRFPKRVSRQKKKRKKNDCIHLLQARWVGLLQFSCVWKKRESNSANVAEESRNVPTQRMRGQMKGNPRTTVRFDRYFTQQINCISSGWVAVPPQLRRRYGGGCVSKWTKINCMSSSLRWPKP